MLDWWIKLKWTGLISQANLLISLGKHSEAEVLLLDALEISEQQLGFNHLNTALTLNNLGQLYVDLSNYERAERVQLRALAIYRYQLGDNHLDTALAQNNLAGLYELQGRYADSESFYLASLEITERQLGANHHTTINTINNLALLYKQQGKYIEAEKLYLRALHTREQQQGTNHPDLVMMLNNLGQLYSNQGRYEESETFYLRALTILKNKLGETATDPIIATILNGTASLYEQQGRYDEAEPLYLQALKINEEQLGHDCRNTAFSLNNLAGLYCAIGRYPEAESLHLRSLKIREEVFGVNHPATAMSLNNLAILYRIQGKYGEAELLHDRALKIREEKLGVEHPDTAMSLNNLARVYEAQQKYSDAEKLYLGGLDTYQKLLGSNHPTTAMSLNNLAQVYLAQQKYPDAESLYLRAMSIRMEVLSENHPDTLMSMHNLASLYFQQHKYDLAEELFLRILNIESQQSWKSSGHHLILNNLALLYKQQERYIEAEKLYEQSLKYARENLHNNNPELSSILENLAAIYIETDRILSALPLLIESVEIITNHLKDLFFYSDDSSRLKQAQLKRSSLDVLLSYILTYLPQDSIAIQAAATATIRWKALATAATATLQNLLYTDRYSHLKSKFLQLQYTCNRITDLVANTAVNETTKKTVDDLDRKRQLLEKELSSEVPEVRLIDRDIDCFTIASNLSPGSTLIEFFQFDRYNLKTNQYIETNYIAFVFTNLNPVEIKLVDLGEVETIDRKIQALRNSIIDRSNEFNNLGIGSQTNKPNKIDNSRLLDRLLAPIINILPPSSKHLIFVPAGSLHLIPFEILPLPDSNELLIDGYQISYLNSARDLLRQNIKIDRPHTSSVIITDPDYDFGDFQTDSIDSVPDKLSVKLNHFNRNLEMAILGKKIVGKLNNPTTYQSAQAIEPLIKSLASPKELVIITHGFAIPKSNYTEVSTIQPDKQLLQIANLDNPMLRSGLALAGANLWLKGKSLPSHLGKGILLAEDIAQMDLWNSQLIVLIACSTGLGEINVTDGVMGLRRAFALAGAKTLIMSLWDVPAQVTMLLMDKFFELYRPDLKISIALQQSQTYIRDITIDELAKLAIGQSILAELSYFENAPKSDLPLKHPYYWGAWICQGG
ncbi:CHAT domain-containing tetratricopeptide repeat protein [Chamaesiphon polymorphus]|uniref:CHAT domain-containing protein n=1 Tax=Chamaesiphon polymorphus CCALA 037 TaxID=2107692 RepID=A0A2T1GFS1_9CYAN|nr:CHAT domain-containing protein [Chamaesiphon polymorphus]PSB56461.1 hypothetical protein C7B77_11745 [Chamaesiphon polymorphus CCALA 037]